MRKAQDQKRKTEKEDRLKLVGRAGAPGGAKGAGRGGTLQRGWPERGPPRGGGARGGRGAGGALPGGGGGGVWGLRTPAPGASAPPSLRPLPPLHPRGSDAWSPLPPPRTSPPSGGRSPKPSASLASLPCGLPSIRSLRRAPGTVQKRKEHGSLTRRRAPNRTIDSVPPGGSADLRPRTPRALGLGMPTSHCRAVRTRAGTGRSAVPLLVWAVLAYADSSHPHSNANDSLG